MAKQIIKSRFDDRILYKCDAETQLLAVQEAISRGADLSGAYLSGADLRGAYLRGVDLRGAYLRDAYLRGVDLRGAYLRGAKFNWQSHELIAAALLRAAGSDVEKRKVAGLILVSGDWCWRKFSTLATDPLYEWAMTTLAEYAQDGDGAPTCVAAAGTASSV